MTVTSNRGAAGLDQRGAVVLCGGGSRRMGRDKASLPFGDETMLARVVRLLEEVVPRRNIVLAAATGQTLPALADDLKMVQDDQEDQGPLPTIIGGLRELREAGVPAAFVTACDAPLLKTAVVDQLFQRLAHPPGGGPGNRFDAVVPADERRLYPLTAAYATSCHVGLSAAWRRNLARGGNNSVQDALRAGYVHVQEISLDELREVDPELDTLRNCNTPEEYQTALQRAGLTSR